GFTVWMQAPASYTGEDVVELQCHGGPKVMGQILRAVLAAGARLATPGEFTLRAFLNGKLDLAQAEAVADLIEAKTSKAAGLAAGQLQGRLSSYINNLAAEITDLLAQIMVGVDFPDDEDAPSSQFILTVMRDLQQKIAALIAKAPAGTIYREGITVMLTGPVNVGKSSLLNALLGRERAIVSASPGTTRDMLEEYLDIDGLPVLLRDSAGIRGLSDLSEAEQIGINRSKAAAAESQLLLLVADLTNIDGNRQELNQLLTISAHRRRLLLLNKVDLAGQTQLVQAKNEYGHQFSADEILTVSAKQGIGIEQLLSAIRNKALLTVDSEEDSLLINNARHQQALLRAEEFLCQGIAGLDQEVPVDVISIDLENAAAALAEITGRAVGEDVLERIFSKFCVGK
ncbi:MAG: tRNA uridine-5-carboxymethylaminomethyl(34) synthesis GTPase MnmE, partial [Clostridiales bacterium]